MWNLSFKIGDHTYPTHWHDEVMGEKAAVARDDLDHVVFQVKEQCKDVAKRLTEELNHWFPDVDY